MEASNPERKRGVKQLLLSYFYWTYPRGVFHYDVMVTLILLFIFITPHLWNYGDKPSLLSAPTHPMQVVSDGGRGMIVTVLDQDVDMPAGAGDWEAKKVLRKAIEPVTGDAVFVDSWETRKDANGNRVWKIWAHR